MGSHVRVRFLQVGSPLKNVISTPAIHPPSQGHFAATLAESEHDSPELNALTSLADAAAIITETGSAGEAAGYGDADRSNGDLSHGKGL